MSRVGKMPVEIPAGVKISVAKNLVTVEGPKGKLEQAVNELVNISIDGNQLTVTRKNDSKFARASHGLYRNLINNMVTGVSKGFSRTLVINGVGYRAEIKGNALVLSVGFSGPVEYIIPKGITITCEGPTKVVVAGIDKQLVGQVSAEIKGVRPPEPYKGKGIKYENETIRRKVGKSGVK